MRKLLLLVAAVTVALWLAPAAHATEGYCCICTACPGPATAVCIQVMAEGRVQTACQSRCSPTGCQIANVIEGACPETAAACEAQFSTSRAPALTTRVAAGVAVLLLGAGLYLIRRRRSVRAPA